MSDPAVSPNRFGTEPAVRRLMDVWSENLALVLESMTGQRFQLAWQAAPSDSVVEDDALWWEQPLHGATEAVVWICSPRSTWEHASNLVLESAGLERVPDEARKTWLEILGQSLAALARAVGSIIGEEVTCSAGAENSAPRDLLERAVVSLTLGDTSLSPLLVLFSPGLLDRLGAGEPSKSAAASTPPDPPAAADESIPPPRASRTFDLLLDVELPVSISFGKTQLNLKDVLKLTTGSIVELNRGVSEPVEVLVNHWLVARGEVVVVDGNYGVRIQQIVSRQERLRSLR